MTKWLPDVSPTDRAVDVAGRSLQTRLEAVRRYLKWAAVRPDEPEHVHQLRVWTRRADAALDLYADLLPKKRTRRLRKRLGRIRRVAGRVRDWDVLARRSEPGADWPAERARAHKKLVARYKRLDRGKRVRRWAARLLDRLAERHADSTETLLDRARASLRPMVPAFFAATPGDACDAQALHQFRIRTKELRYAMELLAGAFPASFRDDLYPAISTLQDKLGLMNDLAVAQERLQKRLKRAGNAAELSELRRRIAATGEELVRAREDLARWWTPESRDALRGRFEELLR